MTNMFRQKYRALDANEAAAIEAVKGYAEKIVSRLDEESSDGRLSSIARTHLETAVMFAVKAITA